MLNAMPLNLLVAVHREYYVRNNAANKPSEKEFSTSGINPRDTEKTSCRHTNALGIRAAIGSKISLRSAASGEKRHIRDIIMPERSCVPIYNWMISR